MQWKHTKIFVTTSVKQIQVLSFQLSIFTSSQMCRGIMCRYYGQLFGSPDWEVIWYQEALTNWKGKACNLTFEMREVCLDLISKGTGIVTQKSSSLIMWLHLINDHLFLFLPIGLFNCLILVYLNTYYIFLYWLFVFCICNKGQ